MSFGPSATAGAATLNARTIIAIALKFISGAHHPLKEALWLTCKAALIKRPSRLLSFALRGRGGSPVKMLKARKKSASAKQAYIEPITCPHCGGQANLMRRTLHPKIKGEIWTFECKDCGKQTEKSKLQSGG